MQVNYKVEYAKTSRSSCGVCKKLLNEGASRVGKNSPSPFHDGYITKWFHVPCFFKKEKKNISRVGQIVGWDQLRPHDQAQLRAFIPEDTSTDGGDSGTSSSASASSLSAAGATMGDLWNLKDAIERDMQLKDLKAVLDHNKMQSSGGRSTLVSRVAEAIYFGVASCPMCQKSDMWFSEGKYRCNAELEWGMCGFEGNHGVNVAPCQVPHDITNTYAFFKSLDTAHLRPRPLSAAARAPIVEYTRDPKQPLKGMLFSGIGYLEHAIDALQTQVIQNGGTWIPSDALNPDVDYVITTYGDVVRAKLPGIVQAKDLRLALVSELLLFRLIQEFGFDQRPFLLAGQLPPIALARLAGTPPPTQKPDADKIASGSNDNMEGGSAAATDQSQAKKPAAPAAAPQVKRGKVDPDSRFGERAVIYIDTSVADKKTMYDVTLTQADITTGVNKFYRLQIIDTDGTGSRFSCFMKWGRIGGDTGGSTKSSVGGLASAKAVWADKYLDKTGNKWDDREKFVKKPGKYFPQEIVDDDDGEDENKKKGDGNGNYDDSLPQYDDADVIPSYLDPRVQDIMRLIFDTDLMRQTMIDLELDVRKMPLGKISKQQITKGYEFLRQIEQVLSSNDESKTFKLSQLTNQFYTLIPHDFGLKRPDNIDNHIILKRKMQQLETLLDLQIAASLLHDEAAELTRTHPLDRHYQMLNINMAPLNKYSREYKTIIKYVTNGHSPSTLNAKLTVMDAFRIERDGERERFVAARYDQVRPRKLLWHGSRVANYVGILSQGLRIAPPEAPMTGYLLGKGVYLADMVEKSAAFCHPSPNNRTGLLLLCDTAVGETYDIKKPEYVTELPDGKLATHALSKIIPDPTKNEVGDDKVIIPVGPPIPSGLPDVFLQHSEFVVYKPEQIQIRYLVKVRFDDVAQSQ